MIDLFSKKGLRALEKWLTKKTVLAFDYDGTLVPIGRDPMKAVLNAPSRSLLQEIAELNPIVIITGRSVQEIQLFTHDLKVTRIGNHGLESPTGSKQALRDAALAVRQWMVALQSRRQNLTDVFIENKKYSLSLHYREAKNERRAIQNIVAVASQLTPKPRIVGGKKIISLIPQGSPDKGQALVQFLKKKKYSSALFVGDDVTDEDVFRLKNKSIFSIRVERSRKSKARYFLKGQKQMNDLLREILALRQKL